MTETLTGASESVHRKRLSYKLKSIYDSLDTDMGKKRKRTLLREIDAIDNLFALGKNIKDPEYKESERLWKEVRAKILKGLKK